MVVTRATARAVGVRRRYDEVPARVHRWVEAQLGSPVVEAHEQAGGMSPGCATRLVTADGAAGFVKAVGPELNPMTPGMFRHEATVLEHLGSSERWARLLAAYDEPDGWVALLLEDVSGRRPDLTDPAHRSAFLTAVDDLDERLRGVGPLDDIATAAESVARWQEVWPALDQPGDLAGPLERAVPAWVWNRAVELEERHAALSAVCAPTQLVHGDIRDDNTISRVDGSVVFVDWGGARNGPDWFDPLLARLEWVETPLFDALVAGSPVLRELGEDHVTTFLTALGAWLGYRAAVAKDLNLPTLNAFRRAESARLLEGARRRLGHTRPAVREV